MKLFLIGLGWIIIALGSGILLFTTLSDLESQRVEQRIEKTFNRICGPINKRK